MINVNKIKTIINITEEESKLDSLKNQHLNINLNNFLISKIFPDIIHTLKHSNKFSVEKNTQSYTIFKNEEYFYIQDYTNLGEFLFEPFSLKNIEYSNYVKDIEDYIRDKHEIYFNLIINNLLPKNIDSEYLDYIFYLFFNKIQNLDLSSVFINDKFTYKTLLNKKNQNDSLNAVNDKFNDIILEYTKKGNIELNIRCNLNNITLKLKEKDQEVNEFVIQEIFNKFLNKNFNFFIKQSSYFSINNHKVDVVEGYSFFNNDIKKLNRKNIEQFSFNNNFIRKTVFK